MKIRAGDIFLIVLSLLALVMVIVAIVMVNSHENLINTPCEELLKERRGTTYVPIPKRCEKGE